MSATAPKDVRRTTARRQVSRGEATAEERLRRIESKLDAAAKHSTNWRKLENVTEPAFALGLLMAATAVTLVSATSGRLGEWNAWLNFASGGLLAYWGVILLKVPVALRSHFVKHENGLESFFAHFEDPKRPATIRSVKAWTDQPDVRATEIRRYLRQAVVASRIGLALAALVLGSLAALSLGIAFFGARRLFGTWWALGIILVAVAGYSALIFWRIRGPRRNRRAATRSK